MANTFDIFKLTGNFMQQYPVQQFPELMFKDNRPYNCLLIDAKDYIIAIPYRTHINHKNAYLFKTSKRSKSARSGLDYSKIVIITDSDYIEPTGYSIDQDEYRETARNIERITEEALAYVDNYIRHFTVQKMDLNAFRRAYRFSTLPYFHKELGISS